MRYTAAIIPLLTLLISFYAAYGADSTTITGQDKNSKIVIDLDGDKLITYSASFVTDSGRVTLEPGNPKLEMRSYGFFIIDKANGFFISVKNTDSGYILNSKINSGSDVIVTKYAGAKDMEQRGLDQKLNAKTDTKTDYDRAPILTESPAEEAKRLLDEDLKKLKKSNDALSKTTKSNINLTYEEYKKLYYDRDDDKIPPADVNEEKKKKKSLSLKLFVSVPKQVKWADELRYNVLVTDSAKIQHRVEYSSFVGNGMEGVAINAIVKDTNGKTVHEISGTTSSAGSWLGTGYVIPDNTVTHKPYMVEITATHKTGELTLRETKEQQFYAVEIISSTNYAPTAHVEVNKELRQDYEVSILSKDRKQILTFKPETCFLLDDVGDIFMRENSNINKNNVHIKQSETMAGCYGPDDSDKFTDMGHILEYQEDEGFFFNLNDTTSTADIFDNITGDNNFASVNSVNINTYKHLLWGAEFSGMDRLYVKNDGNPMLTRDLVQLLLMHGSLTTNNTGALIHDKTDVNELFPTNENLELVFPPLRIHLDASMSEDPDQDNRLSFKWKVTNPSEDIRLEIINPEGTLSPECPDFSKGCEYTVKDVNLYPDRDKKTSLVIDTDRARSEMCFELTIRDGARNSNPFEMCITLAPNDGI